jgi:hypothetical protein
MRDQLFQESADQFDAAVKEALINRIQPSLRAQRGNPAH